MAKLPKRIPDRVWRSQDELKSAIKRLAFLRTSRLLPTIQDLEQLILLSCFDGTEISIIVENDIAEPMPSLSIQRFARGNLRLFETSSELRVHLSSHTQRASRFPKYRCTILQPRKQTLNPTLLQQLAQAADFIRSNSLNYINDLEDTIYTGWKHIRINSDLREASEVAVALAEYISKRFDVNVIHLEHDLVAGVWKHGPRFSNKQGCKDRRVAGLNIRRLEPYLKYRKPTLIKLKGNYVLAVPMVGRRDRPSKPPTQALVVSSVNRIAAAVPTTISRYLDYFSDDFLEQGKLRVLDQMQEQTMGLLQYPLNMRLETNMDTLLARLRHFIEPVFDRVLSLTNAFSATCRLFDIGSRSLALIAERMDKDVKKTVNSTHAMRIPIADVSVSVNAKTYHDAHLYQNGNYEPDLSHHGVYRHRPAAKSEICFPLKFKRVCIGTLNFESPLLDGLSVDRSFLRSICTAIASYVTLEYELNDKHWLARRTQHEQNIHEVKNVVHRNSFPSEYRAEILRYIGDRAAPIADHPVSLRHLRDYVADYIRSELPRAKRDIIAKTRAAEFAAACLIEIEEDAYKVDGYRMHLVLIILKNILDNLRNHCLLAESKVIIKRLARRDFLDITVMSGPILEMTLQRATIAPLPLKIDVDQPTVDRMGLLIVGILARHLGGFVHIGNLVPTARQSIIVVRVPLVAGPSTEKLLDHTKEEKWAR